MGCCANLNGDTLVIPIRRMPLERTPVIGRLSFIMQEPPMSNKPKNRKRKTRQSEFVTINSNAAGIDCGSETHSVAVPPDRDDEPVRIFRSFTADLHRLADWLIDCGVDTVAIESTGVYWIPLFEILTDRGLAVIIVNARHVKNVPGRKTDVVDCQWLQQLHTFGLLRGSFRPDAEITQLRAFVRQRGDTGTRRCRPNPEDAEGSDPDEPATKQCH